MNIDYARIPTLDKNLDLQIGAFEKAGCEKVIGNEVSSSVAGRPSLTQLDELIRSGYIINLITQ